MKNPQKLKEISTIKLTNSSFREWKNTMMADFSYYGIEKIINGSHGPPTGNQKRDFWRETEQLFIRAFAATVPAHIYEDVKQKETLREKWLAILKNYTQTELGKITNDLFNIKFEAKEKFADFVIRLQDTWENLERCGHKIDDKWRIEQLFSKMESTFPNETRELRRSRDVRTLTWDYVVQIYKDVEHTRPTAQSSTGAALTVSSGPDRGRIHKSRSHQSFRTRPNSHHSPQYNEHPNRYQPPNYHNSGNYRGRGRGQSRGRGQGQNRGRSQHNSYTNQNHSSRSRPRTYFCYACYNEGHVLRDCPDLRDFREYRRNQQNQASSNPPRSNLAGMTCFLDNDDEVNYQGHTFMVKSSKPLDDNDWVYDTGAQRSMAKTMESFVEYHPLSRPRMFNAANGGPLTAHGIGTVRIRMQYMDVFVRGVYYVPDVVANLVSAHGMGLSGYRSSMDENLDTKISDSKGNVAGFAVPEDGLYVIHTRRLQYQLISTVTHDPLHR